MIKAISKSAELEKIVLRQLIRQSELPRERVINGLTDFGEDLDKEISTDIFDSIELDNNTLLFELRTRESSSDVSFTEDDSISKYSSFTIYCIVYGDDSIDIASKVCARFRTEDVRLYLLDEGVYIERVSEPTSFNEFKNAVMWKRTDFSIEISCRFEINKPDSLTGFDYDFNLVSFNIIEKEK